MKLKQGNLLFILGVIFLSIFFIGSNVKAVGDDSLNATNLATNSYNNTTNSSTTNSTSNSTSNSIDDSSDNTASFENYTGVPDTNSTTKVSNYSPNSELGISGILNVLLIAVGVLLILLAIAILIKIGK